MEIDEFLTRISLSGAEPTIFTLYEKGKNITATGKEVHYDNRTLKTYTKSEGTTIIGTINYDKPFPKQIFAMEPEGLKFILQESDNVVIDDTYLVASGNMDIRWKLEVLGKGKTMEFAYKMKDIPISKDIVAKIIRADRVINADVVSISSDGKKLGIELLNNMKGYKAYIKMDEKTDVFDAMYGKQFIECIKLVGDKDAIINIDGKKEGMPESMRGLGKIEISDDTAKITYYIAEITRSVNEERKAAQIKKPSENEPEENGDLNLEDGSDGN